MWLQLGAYNQLEAGARLRIASPREDLCTLPLEVSGRMLKCKPLLFMRTRCHVFGFEGFPSLFSSVPHISLKKEIFGDQ